MSDEGIFGLAIGIVIGLVIGIITGSVATNHKWETQALELGVGEYNQKTGKFQFVVTK